MSVCASVCLQFSQQSQILTSLLSAPLLLSFTPPSLVLIGSISVVALKWVLMCTRLMDGMFRCSVFLLTLQYDVPLWANLQHAPLFPSPEGWNVGIVGWMSERGRERGRERKTATGHLPSVVASRGCVASLSAGPYAAPWEDSGPSC